MKKSLLESVLHLLMTSCRLVTKSYIKVSKKAAQNFLYKVHAWNNIHVLGVEIYYTKTSITIHQKNYMQNIKNVDENCDFASFRSSRAQIT